VRGGAAAAARARRIAATARAPREMGATTITMTQRDDARAARDDARMARDDARATHDDARDDARTDRNIICTGAAAAPPPRGRGVSPPPRARV